MPILLLTTPFFLSGSLSPVALPVVSLLVLVGLLAVLRMRIPITKTLPNLALTGFFIVTVALLPFSMLVSGSIQAVLWWAAYLGVFISCQVLISNEKSLKIMAAYFVALTSVFSVFSFYAFIVTGLSSYTRLNGIVGSHNVYGGLLLIPFLLSLYLSLERKPVWQRALWSLSGALMLSGLVLTFSRGTWLSLVVSLVVSIFLFRRHISWRAIKSTAWGLASVVALTCLITAGVWFAAKHNTVTPESGVGPGSAQTAKVGIFSDQDDEDNAFIARLHYFGDALETYIQRPIVGFGAGNYEAALRIYKTDPNYSSFADPHDWLLKMLVEDGIIGAIVFLVFVGSLFWRLWRRLNQRIGDHWLAIAVFTGLFAGALHGLMDFDWSYNLVLLVFFCFAGALFGVLDQSGDDRPKTLPVWAGYVLILILAATAIISVQTYRAASARSDGDFFFYDKGDYNSAIDSYIASTLIYGRDPTTWFDLWRAYFRMGNYGAAKNCLSRAIALFPESGIFYTAWAETDEAQKDFSDYHDTLVNAVKYFPANNLSDNVKLASFDLDQKKYDEASAVIDKVLPIYERYQATLWFVNDPNSPMMSANIKLLEALKLKLGQTR